MIKTLYEAATGRPWTTVRSCTAEYGPPPAVVYADELADLTDADLFEHDAATLVAYAKAKRDGTAAAWRTFEDHYAAEHLRALAS